MRIKADNRTVIPAKAGIHFDDRTDGSTDPGFRRDDDVVGR
jgi:hypothetical protein